MTTGKRSGEDWEAIGRELMAYHLEDTAGTLYQKFGMAKSAIDSDEGVSQQQIDELYHELRDARLVLRQLAEATGNEPEREPGEFLDDEDWQQYTELLANAADGEQ